MKSLPCDIVLVPDDKLANHAVSVSRSLAPFDPNFMLEIGTCYPHLSLYMFQLLEKDIPKVRRALEDIALSFPAYHAQASHYSISSTGHAVGSIFPEYELTEPLQDLQAAVIKAINPMRSGMREKDKAKLVDATGLKRKNLEQYGYPSVGELFHAHITLTRLKTYQPEAMAVLPDIATFSGRFTKIGLFEMGDFGTCIRPLAIVDLP